MNTFRASVVLASLGLMVVVGCGSSDSSSATPAATAGAAGSGGGGVGGSGGGAGGTSGGLSIDEIPAKFAAANCEIANLCYGAELLKVFLGGEDCVTRTQRAIEDGDIGRTKQLVADKKLSYDAAKAQACIDAYKAGGCAQLDKRGPAVCDEVFGGKGAVGDACEIGAECSSGLFCEAGAACPGKCASRKAGGALCTADDNCVDGLKCTGQPGAEKCAASVDEGVACGGSTGAECRAGLSCAGSDDKAGKPGVCKKNDQVFGAKVGQACDVQAGLFCEIGASCELASATAMGVTWMCVAPYASGGACKLAFPNGCPAGEYCPVNVKSQPLKLDGTCTKLPAAGETCGIDSDGVPATCGPYAVCVAGKCADKSRIAGACGLDAACYSDRCKGGKCVAGLSCEPASPAAAK